MKYVLIRTGKLEVIGPFDTIEEAGQLIIDRSLLGYQVIPMKTVDEDKPFPSSQQTDESFLSWTQKFNYQMNSLNHEQAAGRFMAMACKKFPDMFSLRYGDAPRGGKSWYIPQKIRLIKGLRLFFSVNGVDLGLKEAKDLVDTYEDVMGEEKNK